MNNYTDSSIELYFLVLACSPFLEATIEDTASIIAFIQSRSCGWNFVGAVTRWGDSVVSMLPISWYTMTTQATSPSMKALLHACNIVKYMIVVYQGWGECWSGSWGAELPSKISDKSTFILHMLAQTIDVCNQTKSLFKYGMGGIQKERGEKRRENSRD